jgi:hypothetical protein
MPVRPIALCSGKDANGALLSGHCGNLFKGAAV